MSLYEFILALTPGQGIGLLLFCYIAMWAVAFVASAIADAIRKR